MLFSDTANKMEPVVRSVVIGTGSFFIGSAAGYLVNKVGTALYPAARDDVPLVVLALAANAAFDALLFSLYALVLDRTGLMVMDGTFGFLFTSGLLYTQTVFQEKTIELWSALL